MISYRGAVQPILCRLQKHLNLMSVINLKLERKTGEKDGTSTQGSRVLQRDLASHFAPKGFRSLLHRDLRRGRREEEKSQFLHF